MPRKVTVYITASPGDELEKSRTWSREYVKPTPVIGAVDYEIKEAKSPGQIETSAIEEIVQRRRKDAEAASSNAESTDHEQLENKPNTAVGRIAYREVLRGLAKGWDTILAVFIEVRLLEVQGHREDKG